ncbi:hypothetical protein AF332_12640 [Sporosarcina globispora]|uniref:Uncharacterized protein n=1 Tax=Sporosarcina globispora TaxID=1459 RepID=A0A0M0GCM5_SPOGL|nr:hypothetical protein [Sporosarcina globispora]KON87594.1 hypothetical protein AF332_12640 [Sporosarcina globispora]
MKGDFINKRDIPEAYYILNRKRRVRIEQFAKAKGKSIAEFRPKAEDDPPGTLDNTAMSLT